MEADGYLVRKIKVEGGCYEVYAFDKSGQHANMAYKAETLAKLIDPEAGEKWARLQGARRSQGTVDAQERVR